MDIIKAEIVLASLFFLMGLSIGFIIWGLDEYKKKRKIKEELLNKKNLDWQDKLRNIINDEKNIENDWGINFHSTSTQGPPRKSAMKFITLEDLLKKAIEEENYENAAKLRDAIEKQKNNKSNELQ